MFNREYAKYYDLFNSLKPYKKEIDFVFSWANKPKSIFDIGAGTGSYWKYYPTSTYLFGVDQSLSMAHQSSRVAVADITKYKHNGQFDCATALFDVINYIPRHDWWKNIPVKQGGYFIFDLWNTDKVYKDGFVETEKRVGNVTRTIKPIRWNFNEVVLKIEIHDGKLKFSEEHKMYLYSHDDIKKFCGNEFEIVEVKPTEKWQCWFKLKKL